MNIEESSLTSTTYSPAIFSTLFQNMFDAVVIYNYETETIKDCNKSVLQLLGFSKDEFLAMNRFDIMPRYSSLYPQVDIHEFIRKDHRKKVLDGELIYSTGELIKKNGEAAFAQFNIVPTGGAPGDAFVILHDITQELESTKILSESTKKYETIFNNAYESIIYYDLVARESVECNDVVIKMFGTSTKADFLNANWGDFYGPSDGELNQLPFEDFFEKIINVAVRKGNSCFNFLAKKTSGESFVAEVTTSDYRFGGREVFSILPFRKR